MSTQLKKIISAAENKKMPWKNGLGITSEISIEPRGEDFTKNTFKWRLSSAHVSGPNSFSQFPGYDRVLTVLFGKGLKLNNKTLKQFEVLKFSGDEKIDCALLDDEVIDLGIIYDRRFFKCDFDFIQSNTDVTLSLAPGTHFIKPLSGALVVDSLVVEASDILRLEGNVTVSMQGKSFPLHFLKINLSSCY